MFDSSFNKPPSRNSAFTDLVYSENRVPILYFKEVLKKVILKIQKNWKAF